MFPSAYYYRVAALVFVFALACVGLNLLMGFAGQVSLGHAGFMGIGAYAVAVGPAHLGLPSWLAFLAGTTLIFGAAYTLWMYKRVMFGPVANDHVAALQDLNPRELIVLGALALAVLLMGVYPLPFTEVMHGAVNDLLRHVAQPKI